MVALVLSGCGGKDSAVVDALGSTQVEIQTDYGTMTAVLYDSTPLHRDNFIQLANNGYYNDLLFHRVISGFMIQ